MSSIETTNSNVLGREYWLSVQHLANTAQVQQRVDDEFVGYDPEGLLGMSRRRFMQLAAASMALAGVTLTGCRRYPQEKLAPYASRPDDRVPGTTERFATLFELAGVAVGTMATSFDGRPIKLDGHPLHPYSQGASDVLIQASILGLYDPARARHVLYRASPDQPRRTTWAAFQAAVRDMLPTLEADGGRGLAIVSEAGSSLTVERLRQALLAKHPQAQWATWEPIHRRQAIDGATLAFGQAVRPVFLLDRAKVIASFDADLLGAHPAKLKHARDWAAGRRSADEGVMNRLYIAEAGFSSTGGIADVRVALRPGRIEAVLAGVAAAVGVSAAPAVQLDEREQAFVTKLARDLQQHRGEAVVAVGDRLSPGAHALGHAINAAVGAIGATVELIAEPQTSNATLADVTQSLEAGDVKLLVVLGGNPAFDAPADVPFAAAMAKAAASVHLSDDDNETAALATWRLPRAHTLEAWNDGRAWDGTVTVGQPMLEPLTGGRSIAELLSMLLGDNADSYMLIRETFAGLLPSVDFEKAWRKVVHDGIVPNFTADRLSPPVRALGGLELATEADRDSFDVVFMPDSKLFDGRFANNGWLQELPDGLTKLTWDNAALMAKADADRLKLTTGDMVKITVAGRALEIAVYVMPGQPRGVITLPLGYGRTACGPIGRGIGFNTYALRTAADAWVQRAAGVEKLGGAQYTLALTQDHHIIDGVGAWARNKRIGDEGESGMIIREASLDEYRRQPNFVNKTDHDVIALPLYEAPMQFNEPHAWGMAVDMNSCIGCGACTVACQAENNIPIVGKDEVANSREMHWIRVDRYFKGSPDDEELDVAYQPMMCVHCENAPCEQVCPVAATVHDTEGLNTMVYNRCIGTRYCSNNCPYKVRRFNYYDYHSKQPNVAAEMWLGMPDQQQQASIDPLRKMLFNPDVTVRMRGVMEKCTYCTQRISGARIHAKNEWAKGNRPSDKIADGELVTACQEACPTHAIVFGDLNDPNSRVSLLHRNKRTYGVLEELHTAPRTKYLAKIRNPAGAAPGTAPEAAATPEGHTHLSGYASDPRGGDA